MDVLNERRIVILGKTGAGKSSLANTIFGEDVFKIDHRLKSGTSKCQAKTKSVSGRSITLIDTPGLFDTDRSEEELKPEIVRCTTECAPGPHAFLIVLKVERFTEHEQEVINKIQEHFSEEAFKYTTVVFTHGDDLPKGETIADLVRKVKPLDDLVKKCGGRCHVVDNKYWKDTPKNEYRSNKFQVEELLKTIDKMVVENKGSCYTNEMLQAVDQMIKQEEENIRQSSGNMTEEEIRESVKDSVFDWLMSRPVGLGTGPLIGAFSSVVGSVCKGLIRLTDTFMGAVKTVIRNESDSQSARYQKMPKEETSPEVEGGGAEETASEPAGKLTPDSSIWTTREPKVKSVDEQQTYSLQSEAGRFECSVSSLRWVCKEKVSFKYHFSSWDEHREKPSCVDYMPAGPLLDITVMTGKMEEVHLPHWIDHDSTMSDMFAVLHVDTCGDFVEKVSQVTSSHVKLCQPTFSPTGVMIRVKLGFPVKVHYEALIYKTKKEFLTLHVYLVPPDPFVKKEVDKDEKSNGSVKIPKPSQVKPLRMQDNIFVKADKNTAEISPEKLDLKYHKSTPNYFEVFLRNADSDFKLSLEKEGKENSRRDTVWTCTIRKGDYKNQCSDHEQASGQHFVDRHRTALVDRVSDTGHILDKLLERDLISDEKYDGTRSIKNSQEQMREILTLLKKVGTTGKDALYEILKSMRSMRPLISELEGSV